MKVRQVRNKGRTGNSFYPHFAGYKRIHPLKLKLYTPNLWSSTLYALESTDVWVTIQNGL